MSSVVVAHSPKDGVIPFRHGQALLAAANDPKLFIELQGGHNAGIELTPEALPLVTAFLQAFLPSNPGRSP